ncbi:MvdC/MvdD family ATP grasp protein [Streptomyces sp. NPDC090025]|uniref:MvdC/MvdD family ATP grasp protein n=1 Tax=Streptomyces sp. NPDC090025 TaxID=3365922 RepID=UPI003835955F
MTGVGPVLVVTMIDDPTADLVMSELHDRDVPVVQLDSGDFPATLSFAATLTPHGIEGSLSTPTRTADLSRVRSLYYRRPSGFAFTHLDEQDTRFAVTQARYGLGGVYKPLSTPLYRVDGVSCTVEVAEVTADQVDDRVAGTAHLFQHRVDKVADVRVTVIGREVFSVRIDSDLLDWRTDYDRLTYSVVEPPPGITDALHRYLDHFGLVFGAFDFAVDRAGAWWFLECNPSGQWAWMEPETGLPMVAAMADLLERKTA